MTNDFTSSVGFPAPDSLNSAGIACRGRASLHGSLHAPRGLLDLQKADNLKLGMTERSDFD